MVAESAAAMRSGHQDLRVQERGLWRGGTKPRRGGRQWTDVELKHVFAPKEYNPYVTPCWQCLVMMRYDHDGGGEKEVKDFKAADDVKEGGTAEGLVKGEWTGVVAL